MYMKVAPGTSFTDNGAYTGSCPQPTKTVGFVSPTGLGRVKETTGYVIEFSVFTTAI